MLLFIGAVIAYPASLRAKGLGVLIGVVFLGALNLARIMSLYWIGSTYPQYLDVVHLLVWQVLIIIIAIIMWPLWVERMAVARGRQAPSHSASGPWSYSSRSRCCGSALAITITMR